MDLHFSVCNKCKTYDYKILINKLRDEYPDATFDLKCQSFCGPGSNKPFLAVNEIFIQADDVDGLVEEVSKLLGG